MTQITGNVGMYFAAYRLSREGWNVMPTSRNARGVDLIAYSADASRFIGVQVKALSKATAVSLGSLSRLWAIFGYSDQRRRGNPGAQVRDYRAESFREAWHKIGRGDPDSGWPPRTGAEETTR